MPQPQWSLTPWDWTNRAVLKFGGKALPLVGTLMEPLDLNDATSWFVQNVEVAHKKILGLKPLIYQGESAWISEDFEPRTIRVTTRFDEGGGSVTSFLPFPNSSFETYDPTLQTMFRSLGTDATGTLNWWINKVGFSIASNVATANSGPSVSNFMEAGNIELGAGTVFAQRIRCPTLAGGIQGYAYVGWRRLDANNLIQTAMRGSGGGNYLSIEGNIGGSYVSWITTGAFTFTPGTWYWLVGTWSPDGATLTVSAYNDNSLARGTLIGSISATLTAAQLASLPSGRIFLQTFTDSATTISTTGWGGASTNVCQVTSPLPANCTNFQQDWTSAEPGFAWSKFAHSGTYSLSIYFAATTGGGYYAGFQVNAAGWTAAPATNYTYTGYFRTTNATSLTFLISDAVIGGPNVVAPFANAWYRLTGVQASGTGGTRFFQMYAQGTIQAGTTVYFDDPSISHKTPISSFATVKALMSQAGEQYLTTDDMTGVSCKLLSFGSPKLVDGIGSSGINIWETDLEFLAAVPWATDLAQTIIPALAVAGSSGGGTVSNFTLAYAGSVYGKPVFTLTIPSSNTVTISQIKLQNTTTGQILTVNFSPVLPANTAIILTIDCGTWKISDGSGNQYDPIGSFPILAPPAGTVNTWALTIVASAGTTGITLGCTYYNRWEF